MAGPTQPRQTGTPSNFFPGGAKNNSGDTIAKNLIVMRDGTTDGIELADGATGPLCGITDQDIEDGKTGDVQIRGRKPVLSGAAVSIGDKLTSDSQGRAVPLTYSASTPQICVGTANTAASGANELVECDMDDMGGGYAGVASVADRAALKAVGASDRFAGMLVLVREDNSLWAFNESAAQTADAAAGYEQLVVVPTAGDGRWHRADKSFIAKFPIAYTTADGAALFTMPEGFAARFAAHPFWQVAVAFAGGSSSAIGISSNKTGHTTKGDILGGAAGNVEADLTAGLKAGTIGVKLDSLAELQALLLVEGDTLEFDRITSVFTSGSGFLRVPMVVMSDAPATP